MHIKAVRLVSGLVSGAISGTQLETLLADSDYAGALVAGVTAVRGRMNAVAASTTAMNAIAASTTAMNAVFDSPVARGAIHASTIAVDAIASTASAIAWLRANKLLSVTTPAPNGNPAFQTVTGAPDKVLTLSIRNNGMASMYTHTLKTLAAGSRSNAVAATNVAVEHINAYSSLAWSTSYVGSVFTAAAVIEYVDMT